MNKDIIYIIKKMRDMLDDIISEHEEEEMLNECTLNAFDGINPRTYHYLHYAELYRVKDFKKFKRPLDIMKIHGIRKKRYQEIIEIMKEKGLYELIWK